MINRRRIVKTIVYRICSALITVIIVFIVIGRIDIAGIIGGITTVVKTIWYYVFESLWKKWKL
jgi:uncharacterized membrane protein